MCGIFGLISSGKLRTTNNQAKKILSAFYKLSESRGKEASGAALVAGEYIEVVKAPVRGRDFLSLPDAKLISDKFCNALVKGNPFLFIGHTRMVTNGAGDVHGNNQPVIRNELVAIHNGIIVNEAQLWREMPMAVKNFEVDTEVFLALVERELTAKKSFSEAVSAAFSALNGANSVAVLSKDYNAVVLATSNGSMFLAHDLLNGLTLFASEKIILEKIVAKNFSKCVNIKEESLIQLKPGVMATISFPEAIPFFSTISDYINQELHYSSLPRTIIDHPILEKSRSIFKNAAKFEKIDELVKIDWSSIRSLKRCRLCVLPETFPYISFDAEGVCNFCKNHKKLVLKGGGELMKDLSKAKKQVGRPEVLFPISGGRDSCYGLHLLKNVLNVKPIAYTYDWGMVTDLARRNISRMCGSLGVEHVLISADIKKKRDYIKKNVSAWLKAPHLGTIPLFMAGDKQFFYYANKLKTEMGLGSIVFSMNPLERTDFKVGFCGINEAYQKERHYDPKLSNKIRLGAFYASQFIKNPAFINSSLLDSVFAYFSYYAIDRSYLSIFDYLPWSEDVVEQVICEQYGWEKSPDTNSTWRIGDGTAAFYNYIYLKVAGFSENDTFRSNQIREGLITRESALQKIYEENRPRVASIAWYFDNIEIDASEALRIINRMPTLYGEAA